MCFLFLFSFFFGRGGGERKPHETCNSNVSNRLSKVAKILRTTHGHILILVLSCKGTRGNNHEQSIDLGKLPLEFHGMGGFLANLEMDLREKEADQGTNRSRDPGSKRSTHLHGRTKHGNKYQKRPEVSSKHQCISRDSYKTPTNPGILTKHLSNFLELGGLRNSPELGGVRGEVPRPTQS